MEVKNFQRKDGQGISVEDDGSQFISEEVLLESSVEKVPFVESPGNEGTSCFQEEIVENRIDDILKESNETIGNETILEEPDESRGKGIILTEPVITESKEKLPKAVVDYDSSLKQKSRKKSTRIAKKVAMKKKIQEVKTFCDDRDSLNRKPVRNAKILAVKKITTKTDQNLKDSAKKKDDKNSKKGKTIEIPEIKIKEIVMAKIPFCKLELFSEANHEKPKSPKDVQEVPVTKTITFSKITGKGNSKRVVKLIFKGLTKPEEETVTTKGEQCDDKLDREIEKSLDNESNMEKMLEDSTAAETMMTNPNGTDEINFKNKKRVRSRRKAKVALTKKINDDGVQLNAKAVETTEMATDQEIYVDMPNSTALCDAVNEEAAVLATSMKPEISHSIINDNEEAEVQDQDNTVLDEEITNSIEPTNNCNNVIEDHKQTKLASNNDVDELEEGEIRDDDDEYNNVQLTTINEENVNSRMTPCDLDVEDELEEGEIRDDDETYDDDICELVTSMNTSSQEVALFCSPFLPCLRDIHHIENEPIHWMAKRKREFEAALRFFKTPVHQPMQKNIIPYSREFLSDESDDISKRQGNSSVVYAKRDKSTQNAYCKTPETIHQPRIEERHFAESDYVQEPKSPEIIIIKQEDDDESDYESTDEEQFNDHFLKPRIGEPLSADSIDNLLRFTNYMNVSKPVENNLNQIQPAQSKKTEKGQPKDVFPDIEILKIPPDKYDSPVIQRKSGITCFDIDELLKEDKDFTQNPEISSLTSSNSDDSVGLEKMVAVCSVDESTEKANVTIRNRGSKEKSNQLAQVDVVSINKEKDTIPASKNGFFKLQEQLASIRLNIDELMREVVAHMDPIATQKKSTKVIPEEVASFEYEKAKQIRTPERIVFEQDEVENVNRTASDLQIASESEKSLVPGNSAELENVLANTDIDENILTYSNDAHEKEITPSAEVDELVHNIEGSSECIVMTQDDLNEVLAVAATEEDSILDSNTEHQVICNSLTTSSSSDSSELAAREPFYETSDCQRVENGQAVENVNRSASDPQIPSEGEVSFLSVVFQDNSDQLENMILNTEITENISTNSDNAHYKSVSDSVAIDQLLKDILNNLECAEVTLREPILSGILDEPIVEDSYSVESNNVRIITYESSYADVEPDISAADCSPRTSQKSDALDSIVSDDYSAFLEDESCNLKSMMNDVKGVSVKHKNAKVRSKVSKPSCRNKLMERRFSPIKGGKHPLLCTCKTCIQAEKRRLLTRINVLKKREKLHEAMMKEKLRERQLCSPPQEANQPPSSEDTPSSSQLTSPQPNDSQKMSNSPTRDECEYQNISNVDDKNGAIVEEQSLFTLTEAPTHCDNESSTVMDSDNVEDCSGYEDNTSEHQLENSDEIFTSPTFTLNEKNESNTASENGCPIQGLMDLFSTIQKVLKIPSSTAAVPSTSLASCAIAGGKLPREEIFPLNPSFVEEPLSSALISHEPNVLFIVKQRDDTEDVRAAPKKKQENTEKKSEELSMKKRLGPRKKEDPLKEKLSDSSSESVTCGLQEPFRKRQKCRTVVISSSSDIEEEILTAMLASENANEGDCSTRYPASRPSDTYYTQSTPATGKLPLATSDSNETTNQPSLNRKTTMRFTRDAVKLMEKYMGISPKGQRNEGSRNKKNEVGGNSKLITANTSAENPLTAWWRDLQNDIEIVDEEHDSSKKGRKSKIDKKNTEIRKDLKPGKKRGRPKKNGVNQVSEIILENEANMEEIPKKRKSRTSMKRTVGIEIQDAVPSEFPRTTSFSTESTTQLQETMKRKRGRKRKNNVLDQISEKNESGIFQKNYGQELQNEHAQVEESGNEGSSGYKGKRRKGKEPIDREAVNEAVQQEHIIHEARIGKKGLIYPPPDFFEEEPIVEPEVPNNSTSRDDCHQSLTESPLDETRKLFGDFLSTEGENVDVMNEDQTNPANKATETEKGDDESSDDEWLTYFVTGEYANRALREKSSSPEKEKDEVNNRNKAVGPIEENAIEEGNMVENEFHYIPVLEESCQYFPSTAFDGLIPSRNTLSSTNVVEYPGQASNMGMVYQPATREEDIIWIDNEQIQLNGFQEFSDNRIGPKTVRENRARINYSDVAQQLNDQVPKDEISIVYEGPVSSPLNRNFKRQNESGDDMRILGHFVQGESAVRHEEIMETTIVEQQESASTSAYSFHQNQSTSDPFWSYSNVANYPTANDLYQIADGELLPSVPSLANPIQTAYGANDTFSRVSATTNGSQNLSSSVISLSKVNTQGNTSNVRQNKIRNTIHREQNRSSSTTNTLQRSQYGDPPTKMFINREPVKNSYKVEVFNLPPSSVRGPQQPQAPEKNILFRATEHLL